MSFPCFSAYIVWGGGKGGGGEGAQRLFRWSRLEGAPLTPQQYLVQCQRRKGTVSQIHSTRALP